MKSEKIYSITLSYANKSYEDRVCRGPVIVVSKYK